jgi:hypothetical protein
VSKEGYQVLKRMGESQILIVFAVKNRLLKNT